MTLLANIRTRALASLIPPPRLALSQSIETYSTPDDSLLAIVTAQCVISRERGGAVLGIPARRRDVLIREVRASWSRCRRAILFVGPTHDDPERIIRQWSLQRLRLVPRRTHPHIPFLLGRQDHRHRLGMDPSPAFALANHL
jgi:hypothetical protein